MSALMTFRDEESGMEAYLICKISGDVYSFSWEIPEDFPRDSSAQIMIGIMDQALSNINGASSYNLN